MRLKTKKRLVKILCALVATLFCVVSLVLAEYRAHGANVYLSPKSGLLERGIVNEYNSVSTLKDAMVWSEAVKIYVRIYIPLQLNESGFELRDEALKALGIAKYDIFGDLIGYFSINGNGSVYANYRWLGNLPMQVDFLKSGITEADAVMSRSLGLDFAVTIPQFVKSFKFLKGDNIVSYDYLPSAFMNTFRTNLLFSSATLTIIPNMSGYNLTHLSQIVCYLDIPFKAKQISYSVSSSYAVRRDDRSAVDTNYRSYYVPTTYGNATIPQHYWFGTNYGSFLTESEKNRTAILSESSYIDYFRVINIVADTKAVYPAFLEMKSYLLENPYISPTTNLNFAFCSYLVLHSYNIAPQEYDSITAPSVDISNFMSSCDIWDIPCHLGNTLVYMIFEFPLTKPFTGIFKILLGFIKAIFDLLTTFGGLGVLSVLIVGVLVMSVIFKMIK